MANETKNAHQSILAALSAMESSTSVKYPGVDLKTKGLTEWVEVFVQGPVGRPSRGLEQEFEITVNCFARVGFTTVPAQEENAFRHLQLADAVMALLSAQDLAVEDHEGGSEEVVHEYDLTNAGAHTNFQATSVRRGQSWQNDVLARTVTGYAVETQLRGSPPSATATARIYAHSGTYGTSSIPTGAALASAPAVDITTWTGVPFSPVREEFTFTNRVWVPKSSPRVITMEMSQAFSPSDGPELGVDNSSPTYAGSPCQAAVEPAGWNPVVSDWAFEIMGLAQLGLLRMEEASVVVLNDAEETNLQQATVSVGGLLIT